MMKIPTHIRVFGDVDYRGKCPTETVEQVTFFGLLRTGFKDTYGRIAIHPRNEGNRTHQQTMRYKSEGMTPGASDIIIPGKPTFVCELKRKDHTKSRWQDNQLEYLEAAQDAGCFVCVAFGYRAAWEAFTEWRLSQEG